MAARGAAAMVPIPPLRRIAALSGDGFALDCVYNRNMTNPMKFSVVAVFLVAVALAAPAYASPEVYQYRIEHPIFGDVGTYTNSIERIGDRTHVETAVQVVVRLLGIVVYRQNATRSEDWRNGRLMAFHGVTNTNGTPLEVTGEARGDEFAITSPAGNALFPANVRPSNPWSERELQSNLMMSTRTGQVDIVRISGGEETPVTFDGVERKLHQYLIEGRKRDLVWCDDRGVTIAFRSEQGGTMVDFILVSITPGDRLAASAP